LLVTIPLLNTIESRGHLNYQHTIYVNDDADKTWYDATHVKTIQEGIDNASNHDLVFVYNETYNENVVIDKSIQLFGEGATYLGDVAGGAVREYLQAFPGMNNIYDAKIIEQVIFFGDPSLKIGGYQ